MGDGRGSGGGVAAVGASFPRPLVGVCMDVAGGGEGVCGEGRSTPRAWAWQRRVENGTVLAPLTPSPPQRTRATIHRWRASGRDAMD